MPKAEKVDKWAKRQEQGDVLSRRKALAVRRQARQGPVGPSEAEIQGRLGRAGAQAGSEVVGLMSPGATTPGQRDGRSTRQAIEQMKAGAQHILASKKGIREQATEEKIQESALRERAHQYDESLAAQTAARRGQTALRVVGSLLGGTAGFFIGGPAGAAMGAGLGAQIGGAGGGAAGAGMGLADHMEGKY